MRIKFFLVMLITFIIQSCDNENVNTKKYDVIFSNKQNSFSSGQKAKITISPKESDEYDSVTFSLLKNTYKAKITNNEFFVEIPKNYVGGLQIQIHIYYNNSSEKHNLNSTVVSDIIPKEKRFKVKKVLKHSIKSYTQGYEVTDGYLYESTGQYGESTLQKINLKTFIPEKSIPLSSEFFGEGLTIVGDSIFQITWKERTGFIYNKNSLEKIGQFIYNTEGWGLCYNGTHIILSDGTNILYFYNPKNFSLSHQISVYDNRQAVTHLNELEYINGYIYANIYTTNYIVKIDPLTGKILESIDLTGLLTDEMKHNSIDVLNGIAYDKKENRIFVTGKNWPFTFDVEFIDKN